MNKRHTSRIRGRQMNSKRSRGFSMMELLVAVVVMGVGVLGVTGLQLVSLQNNQAALMRAEAVQFAYDILDRMRMNDVLGYDGMDMGEEPNNGTNCVEATCTLAEMVEFDLMVWKCSLGAWNEEDWCDDLRASDAMPGTDAMPGLPNGDGSIQLDPVVPGFVTVTIQWTGFDGQLQSIEMRSRV